MTRSLLDSAEMRFEAAGSWEGVSTRDAYLHGYLAAWEDAKNTYAKNVADVFRKSHQDIVEQEQGR